VIPSVPRKGEVFEYQEEDQGQANQGKPSILMHIESYFLPAA
jgi:hypothetical protein